MHLPHRPSRQPPRRHTHALAGRAGMGLQQSHHNHITHALSASARSEARQHAPRSRANARSEVAEAHARVKVEVAPTPAPAAPPAAAAARAHPPSRSRVAVLDLAQRRHGLVAHLSEGLDQRMRTRCLLDACFLEPVSAGLEGGASGASLTMPNKWVASLARRCMWTSERAQLMCACVWPPHHAHARQQRLLSARLGGRGGLSDTWSGPSQRVGSAC
jgi:hypothetical protein